MKKRLALILLLLSLPAWADDDDLPQFPKIAPPDPLPEAACDQIAHASQWGLGDWVGPNLRVHVEAASWSLNGQTTKSGNSVTLEACSVNLNAESVPVFAGVRTEDGQMYGVLWTDSGKTQRIKLRRP